MALLPAIVERLKGLIPAGWFARDRAPVRDAVFGGLSDALEWLRGFVAHARSQTRIATASGIWLDLIAWDFFGPRFRRRRGEPDAGFRPRILAELLRPRNTRAAIIRAITDLTGITPEIREPWNPADNGAWGRRMAYGGVAQPAVRVTGYNQARSRYGRGTFSYATARPAIGGSAGAGHYGSQAMRDQILVRVRRGGGGVAFVGPAGGYNTGRLAWGGRNLRPPEFLGWNTSRGGWSNRRLGWLRYSPPYSVSPGHGFYTDSAAQERISDAEIYATIAATKAAGIVAWVNIRP